MQTNRDIFSKLFTFFNITIFFKIFALAFIYIPLFFNLDYYYTIAFSVKI